MKLTNCMEKTEMETAKIKYRKQEWEVQSGMTVRAAIEKIGLDPYNVLALRDKKLINDQTILEPGDEIRLVNVISGG
jgi:sulfur carrier protein ThiS